MIIRDNYRNWAIKNGYGVIEENSEMIFDGLDAKKEAFGIAYCPCVTTLCHNKSYICPCIDVKLKVSPFGECTCRLFKWE